MIKITFEVPNLNEAEFVLQAVRARLEEFRQPNGAGPVVQDVSVEVSPTVQPVVQTIVPTVADAPKKGPGRPKKAAEPVVEAPAPAPASTPVAATPEIVSPPTPVANIFDAPAAAPAQAGRTPKDALNALYTKMADAKGAGAAITATMGLLKEFGVSRVQDVPQDKWVAFDQRVAAMGA